MPRNFAGGKNYKKRKTKGPIGPGPVIYCDSSQQYGVVMKKLGNGLLDLLISPDGATAPVPALGRIRGILRKRRVPFHEGSIVIVSTRDFESGTVGKGEHERIKVDVLHCYHNDHINILLKENRIPYSFRGYLQSKAESPTHDGEIREDAFLFGEEEEEPGDDIDIDNL